MLMKLIYVFPFEACVTVVHVAEPPLRRVMSCNDRNFFNILHYKVGHDMANWGTHRTSKDLFVVDVIVFENVFLENKFSFMMLLMDIFVRSARCCSWWRLSFVMFRARFTGMCSTMTLTSPVMSIKTIIRWILMPSMWLDMSPVITSVSFWKPGCPLRICTLRTTTFCTLLSQRPANPWHAHEFRATFLFETLHVYFFAARGLNVQIHASPNPSL